jgi:hypothetical protein
MPNRLMPAVHVRARPYGNAELVQEHGRIIGMYAVQGKRDHAGRFGRLAEDMQSVNEDQLLLRIFNDPCS